MRKKIAEKLYRNAEHLQIIQAALLDGEQKNLAEVVAEVAESIDETADEILGRDRYIYEEADTHDF